MSVEVPGRRLQLSDECTDALLDEIWPHCLPAGEQQRWRQGKGISWVAAPPVFADLRSYIGELRVKEGCSFLFLP